MLNVDELFDEAITTALSDDDRRFVGLPLTREADYDVTLFAGPGAADRAREYAERATRSEGRDARFGRFLKDVQSRVRAGAAGDAATEGGD